MRSPARFAPLILVATTIAVLSHQPGDRLYLPQFFLADKLAHLGAYTALGVSAIVALGEGADRWPPARFVAAVALFCLLFGITDEIHQSFVPLRQPSVADLAADTLGGLLAGIGWRLRRRAA